MKKLLGAMLFLGAFAIFAHAGTPIDQAGQVNQGPYSNTTLWASTQAASNAQSWITFPAITKVSGSTSYNGRNCLTKFVVGMSTSTTFYIIDGGLTDSATNYVLKGVALGASGFNVLRESEDHLGPLCGTAGNALTLILTAGGTTTSGSNTISAEGFTFFPYGANSGQ